MIFILKLYLEAWLDAIKREIKLIEQIGKHQDRKDIIVIKKPPRYEVKH